MKVHSGSTTRRGFLTDTVRHAALAGLASSAAVSLLGAQAAAAARHDDEDQYDFLMPRVRFVCDEAVTDTWNITPGGDRNLLEELSSVIRCKVKLPPVGNFDQPYLGEDQHFNAVVDFDHFDDLRRYPFLCMTSEGHFRFTNAQKSNLKKYVEEGGFIFMDDCILMSDSDYFYQSAYKLLEETFGKGSVVKIPNNHEVMTNIYDLSRIGLPHVSGTNHGARGVFAGDRLGIFLSSTDIHCGWTDRPGRWYPKPGRHGYKEAIQLGINVIMYSLSH
jgi:hypothetical protein